jgi:hypothetical protein
MLLVLRRANRIWAAVSGRRRLIGNPSFAELLGLDRRRY